MAVIRRLPEGVVNRIAAGEVIERPASVVKELVENAIDAGASRIGIELDRGGRGLILVSDDGIGMDGPSLRLAIERHATSKLADDDLVQIGTLGFRGEALPAIAAVSRLRICSRPPGAAAAGELAVEGGELGPVRPAAGQPGTRVEVRDLFYRTPARLKFLRSDRAECDAAVATVRQLALARPEIGFSVTVDGRIVLDLPPAGDLLEDEGGARLSAILGQEFLANAIAIEAIRPPFRLRGHAGLPTLTRADARMQYLVVNRRPVQDRLLRAALKVAYADLLFRDRHPLAVLHLELPAELVDVNVHPTKAEVRFRDAALVRGLVIGGLKRALAEHGHRASGSVAAGLGGGGGAAAGVFGADRGASAGLAEASIAFQAPATFDLGPPGAAAERSGSPPGWEAGEYPLGVARAQLLGTYILAETPRGLVIVDQHAAHERLAYERLKRQHLEGGVQRQLLLVPAVVELEASEREVLCAEADELARFGLVLEPFGPGAVLVRELPAVLGDVAPAALVRDVAADLVELGTALALETAVDRVLGRMACHGSIRAGRRLGTDEMNALLRAIEGGQFTGQCIHGRPTYVELATADLERLFARR